MKKKTFKNELKLGLFVAEVEPVVVEAALSNGHDLIAVTFDQLGEISNILKRKIFCFKQRFKDLGGKK